MQDWVQVAQGKSGGLTARLLHNMSNNLQPILEEWRSRIAQMSLGWAPSLNAPAAHGTVADPSGSTNGVMAMPDGGAPGLSEALAVLQEKVLNQKKQPVTLARGACMQLQRAEDSSGIMMVATSLIMPSPSPEKRAADVPSGKTSVGTGVPTPAKGKDGAIGDNQRADQRHADNASQLNGKEADRPGARKEKDPKRKTAFDSIVTHEMPSDRTKPSVDRW